MCCTHLNDDESVHQQHADERVLAREEHVRVAEDAVLEDEQHSQDEERAVLHEDRHNDADYVRRTAGVALQRVGRRRGDALAACVETPSRRGALVAVKTMVNWSTLHDQMPRITLHRSRLYFTCRIATCQLSVIIVL